MSKGNVRIPRKIKKKIVKGHYGRVSFMINWYPRTKQELKSIHKKAIKTLCIAKSVFFKSNKTK